MNILLSADLHKLKEIDISNNGLINLTEQMRNRVVLKWKEIEFKY